MLSRLAVPLALLFAVPVAPALNYLAGASPLWLFVAGATAIVSRGTAGNAVTTPPDRASSKRRPAGKG